MSAFFKIGSCLPPSRRVLQTEALDWQGSEFASAYSTCRAGPGWGVANRGSAVFENVDQITLELLKHAFLTEVQFRIFACRGAELRAQVRVSREPLYRAM